MSENTNGSMNEGNVATVEITEPRMPASKPVERARELLLVVDDRLAGILGDRTPGDYRVVLKGSLDQAAIVDAVSAGSSLVWIGSPDGLPEDLWLGTFRPSETALVSTVSAGSPLIAGDPAFNAATLHSGYIKPVKEMYYHNLDEEIRADFIPILEARDRFGEVIGYPGVLMAHHAPSLVGRRFEGAECFFFLFDDPSSALGADPWVQILESIAFRYRSALHLLYAETDYASYQPGERVKVTAHIANLRDKAASAEIRFYVKGPNDAEFRHIVSHRRCPNGGGQSEAVCDFRVEGDPGLWAIRVDACQEARAEELAIEGHPVPIDRREIGFVLFDGAVKTPEIMSVNGPSIRMDGKDAFWAGTHYYPSSSWWEWVWRDFRPLQADRDLSGIRRTGYRIARIWIDPVLDEETLRSLEAGVYLAAQHGIVLDVCVFSQWVRTMGFERPNGEQVRFDFKHRRDGNIYSISLRNMDLQREYMRILATRLKDAGNIVYNLSNETYVKDPDHSQMDQEVIEWDGIPAEHGSLRDTLLFRRWAKEIAEAVRGVGGKQMIIPSYMFSTLDGGDTYLANRDADIVPWHCYMAALTGLTLAHFDPICTNRPIILEEFGALGWNPTENYDGNAHYGLAGGAAAAMAYEWGVSWMAREMCFIPLPLREAVDEEIDDRWFQPYVEVSKTWPSNGVGICATPSGFGYGSIYHGTPFPAEAAVALGRLGLMGDHLAREFRPESAYVLVPQSKNTNMDAVYNVFRELWLQKAIVGTWHEDCLDSLPETARVLICPDGTTIPESSAKLDAVRGRGVQVFMESDEGWKTSPDIPRLEVSSGDGVLLLTRRTIGGTLYSLFSEGEPETATIKTESGATVTLGLSSYAMAHETESGIRMVEGSGDVRINGTQFAHIATGRAIIASTDDSGLLRAGSLRVIATEPTQITFTRRLASYTVHMEGAGESVPISLGGSSTLAIDGEMLRYPVVVAFA